MTMETWTPLIAERFEALSTSRRRKRRVLEKDWDGSLKDTKRHNSGGTKFMLLESFTKHPFSSPFCVAGVGRSIITLF